MNKKWKIQILNSYLAICNLQHNHLAPSTHLKKSKGEIHGQAKKIKIVPRTLKVKVILNNQKKKLINFFNIWILDEYQLYGQKC